MLRKEQIIYHISQEFQKGTKHFVTGAIVYFFCAFANYQENFAEVIPQ